MLSSFEETSRVFNDRGICIGINTIRMVAQRFASRAKIGQHLEALPYTESLDQRRVVVSTDGGRVRIRKNKRGPRTKKGRRTCKTYEFGILSQNHSSTAKLNILRIDLRKLFKRA
jgi:hypothetical protein